MSPRTVAGMAGSALALTAAVTLSACGAVFPQRSEGEKLYRKHCAECHGLDAAGNTPGYMGNAYADLRDDVWKTGGDSDSMQSVVRNGIFAKMPAYDQLSAKEVRQVVDYVRELRGEKMPEARTR
ncbi:MAG TPA: c-type cytochrome [Thermoanaerobaculia bacterium]|nr:c-type cytochrome [Thermoanaerobaculia bacterium]